MTKSNEEKPKYESPVVVKLNEIGTGSGDLLPDCQPGSNAFLCSSGGTAESTCNVGNNPNVV
jgi:hypothetical protein